MSLLEQFAVNDGLSWCCSEGLVKIKWIPFHDIKGLYMGRTQEKHSEMLIEWTFVWNTRHHNSNPHFCIAELLKWLCSFSNLPVWWNNQDFAELKPCCSGWVLGCLLPTTRITWKLPDHVEILFWGSGQGCTSNYCDCIWTRRLNFGVDSDCLLVLKLLAVLN